MNVVFGRQQPRHRGIGADKALGEAIIHALVQRGIHHAQFQAWSMAAGPIGTGLPFQMRGDPAVPASVNFQSDLDIAVGARAFRGLLTVLHHETTARDCFDGTPNGVAKLRWRVLTGKVGEMG